MKKSKLLIASFIIAGLFIFPTNVRAFSLRDLSSSSINFLTKIQEKLEYTFAFSNAQKIKVLTKQAEKRLTDAQKEAKAGNEESVTSLVNDYRNIKEEQSKLMKDNKDTDNMVNEVKVSTINEQKTIKTIVENVSSNTAKTVVGSDRAAVADIKEVVVVKEGTSGGKEFDNSITTVWAPGTGPAKVVTGGAGGEKNNVTVVGGLPTYAAGTTGGGEGGVKVSGDKPGIAPGTSSGGEGGQKVVGGNGGSASGTSGGGEAGQTVSGDNSGTTSNTTSGGSEQKVVGE